MAKYYCKTRCHYRGRVWSPGESFEATADEKVPRHFVEKEVKTETQDPARPTPLSQATGPGDPDAGYRAGVQPKAGEEKAKGKSDEATPNQDDAMLQ